MATNTAIEHGLAERMSSKLDDHEAGMADGAGHNLALAPLVDQVAYGFARVLVVAMKELEIHIAKETRHVEETVGRRLDTMQAALQDLTGAVSEQKSLNLKVQEKCLELASVTAALQESDERQQAELTALRSETKEFSTAVSERIEVLCRELGVQQEDVTAIKSTLCGLSSRMDALVERLDRQADALRSMYATYAQREKELEQLVEGLARLRASPALTPTNGL